MTKELKVFLWVLIAGIGLVMVLKYLFPLMAPFLLGIVFACLIEPLVKRIDTRLRVGRKFAVILILLVLVVVVFCITGLSLLALYGEALRLLPRIPGLVDRFLGFTREGLGYFSKLFPQLGELGQKFSIPPESTGQVLHSLLIGVIHFLPRFPQLLLAIGLGGVTAYFFGRDKKEISQLFYRFLPQKWQSATINIKTEVMTSVTRFIRVECILILITTSLTTLFFFLLGRPAALAYGFLAGLLDFLPVLGPGLVYIPLAFINFLFKDYLQALWLIVAYFLLLFIRQVAEFKLIGANLDLHPIISFLVLYFGIQIFGLAGIFLGPIIIIILRAFYRVLMGLEPE